MFFLGDAKIKDKHHSDHSNLPRLLVLWRQLDSDNSGEVSVEEVHLSILLGGRDVGGCETGWEENWWKSDVNSLTRFCWGENS